MIGDCLICQSVERSGSNVQRECAVPGRSVELRIPTPELRELVVGQRLDFAFELLDLGHVFSITQVREVRLTPAILLRRSINGRKSGLEDTVNPPSAQPNSTHRRAASSN